MKVTIKPSTAKGKKYTATFFDGDKKVKTVHFGAKNYLDRTIGATDEQQKAYKARHAGDNLSDKFSPGSLSMYVLWSSKSLSQGIKNYKSKFGLK